jgi:hypothetical protein
VAGVSGQGEARMGKWANSGRSRKDYYNSWIAGELDDLDY